MSNYLDITYCSKINCKNKKCERNQSNLDIEKVGNHPISIMNFEKCEVWKDEKK